ncbi:MAG: hypothetical protein K9M75_00055 [Phycisphaerae bacterium]|nr:hypothetical protein [Phycisphaerae bacterium]
MAFHAGNKDTFGNNTLPDSNWWDGSSSDFYISMISGNWQRAVGRSSNGHK